MGIYKHLRDIGQHTYTRITSPIPCTPADNGLNPLLYSILMFYLFELLCMHPGFADKYIYSCTKRLQPFRGARKARINRCCSFGGGQNTHGSTNALLTQDGNSLPRLYKRLHCYSPAYQRLLACKTCPKRRCQKTDFQAVSRMRAYDEINYKYNIQLNGSCRCGLAGCFHLELIPAPTHCVYSHYCQVRRTYAAVIGSHDRVPRPSSALWHSPINVLFGHLDRTALAVDAVLRVDYLSIVSFVYMCVRVKVAQS